MNSDGVMVGVNSLVRVHSPNISEYLKECPALGMVDNGIFSPSLSRWAFRGRNVAVSGNGPIISWCMARSIWR